jgi:uncharacterized protein YyaL (SSP411 family)
MAQIIKKTILIALFCSLCPRFMAQLNRYQFEQIDSLQAIEKRNVVVFIHTDWCKYCQKMLNTTFLNETVIKILNTRFYFINFDAESRKSITFNDTIFNFKSNALGTGVHGLAEALHSKNAPLTFPYTCFLSPDKTIIFQYAAYLGIQDFLNKLEDHYLQKKMN